MSRLSVVASVEIDEVIRLGEAVWSRFSEAEREELEGCHPQSIAGFLAVKRALCALCHEQCRTLVIEERDFELHRSSDGAPIVMRAKPLNFEAKSSKNVYSELSVSISHTRVRAYGLAVRDDSVRKTGADER